ncbi:unnamed protein product, partial [Urochloa humidicola]
ASAVQGAKEDAWYASGQAFRRGGGPAATGTCLRGHPNRPIPHWPLAFLLGIPASAQLSPARPGHPRMVLRGEDQRTVDTHPFNQIPDHAVFVSLLVRTTPGPRKDGWLALAMACCHGGPDSLLLQMQCSIRWERELGLNANGKTRVPGSQTQACIQTWSSDGHPNLSY